MHRYQSGISLSGFLGLLVLLGSLAFIAMKLFPAYSENYSVTTSMKGVAEDPEVAGKNAAQIKNMLMKRLQVSYVENVKSEHVRVSREKDGGYVISVSYEVRKPLIHNLDYVARFDNEVRVGQASD